eukprot:2369723-Pleurochrysis_carterae.AAC.5
MVAEILQEKDTVYEFDLPASYNVMLFVRTGDVFVCNREEPVGKARLVMLGCAPSTHAHTHKEHASLVLNARTRSRVHSITHCLTHVHLLLLTQTSCRAHSPAQA